MVPLVDLNRRIVVRQLAGRVGWGLLVVASVYLVARTLGQPWRHTAQLAGFLGLVLVGTWLFWGAATMVVDGSGISINNPLRTLRLPWSSVAGARNDWGLVVTDVDGHDHRVWAAPARGGMSPFASQHPAPLPRLFGPAETSHVNLDAQRAARLVEETRIEVADHSPSTLTTPSAVVRGWRRWEPCLLVACALLLIISLL